MINGPLSTGYKRLDVRDMFDSIDLKVANEFLSNTNVLRGRMRCVDRIKIEGETPDKWLVAVKGCQNHSEHVSSLNRCIGACSAWIVTFYYDNPVHELTPKPRRYITYNGEPLRNSLADKVGLPNDNELYFLHTDGLGSIISVFPRQAALLIGWRCKHKDALGYMPEHIRTLVSKLEYYQTQERDKNEPITILPPAYCDYLSQQRPRISRPNRISEFMSAIEELFK